MSNDLVLTDELQNKVLKVRIYPTNEQVSLLNQTFGCCRKLYNEHLQERNEFYIDNILPIKSKVTKQEIKADRYFPSSQLCNVCGFQYKDLKLSERTWICPKCGTNHIRDVNAAINLMKYVPLEERELTPVDSDTISDLAMLALQAGTLDETGKVVQATLPRNVPGL